MKRVGGSAERWSYARLVNGLHDRLQRCRTDNAGIEFQELTKNFIVLFSSRMLQRHKSWQTGIAKNMVHWILSSNRIGRFLVLWMFVGRPLGVTGEGKNI